MKVGYFTMPLHPPGSNITETLESDLQQIILLDQLGYSEAWIGEHFTAQWENIPAPDLFIAKALALTKNIRLGTGVTCMPNHNPFMIAHRIAQLDHMAKGRFNWGVGSGGFPGDFEVFGFDPQNNDHREMSQQSVELITSMWSDPKPGRYKSKYWDFTIPEPDEDLGLKFHVSPYQKPHPPIGVAGVSPHSETLKIAGERGWIPMSINIVPGNIVKGHWEAVKEGAERQNKQPDRSQWRVAREIFVANTREEAEEEALTGVMARDYNDYFLKLTAKTKLLNLFKRDPDMPDSEVTLKYIMDNIWIVGTPDDVTEKIRALYDEVGIHSMKLLSDTVIPRLSDL